MCGAEWEGGRSGVGVWGGVGWMCGAECDGCVGRSGEAVWGEMGGLCGAEWDGCVGQSVTAVWGGLGRLCGAECDGCVGRSVTALPLFAGRLAEKKASIGYTYEDSTVAELENAAENRGDVEDSEEESNTDEDEVIPDIGARIGGGVWGGSLCVPVRFGVKG